MARKVLSLLLLASIGALIAAVWPELVRYYKIEMIGSGHPELVPASGRHEYPERPHSVDGSDEFDPGARGGPVQALSRGR
jgi:hypothetical protein